VNDIATAAEALRSVILSVPGYQLAWLARNGAEAVEQCRQDTPDLMPRADARSTTRRTAATPARWPAIRGRPRYDAQRPLPSIMMATCNSWERSRCIDIPREMCLQSAGHPPVENSVLRRDLWNQRHLSACQFGHRQRCAGQVLSM